MPSCWSWPLGTVWRPSQHRRCAGIIGCTYVCTYVCTVVFIIYFITLPLCQELISCLVNAEEVQSIVSTPGRRYQGVGGVEVAAAKVQATFRMYRARKCYMEHRRKKWAGSVIAMGWLLHLQARKTRTRLRERQAEERAAFLRRAQEFKKTWSRVKAERHVVVHLPSLGE